MYWSSWESVLYVLRVLLARFGGSLICGCLQNFIFSIGARREKDHFNSTFYTPGVRVWKTERGESNFYWQLCSSLLHFLPQRDKARQRVYYSRTQICVWLVPATVCQPGTQIISDVSKAEASRGGPVCWAHTACVLPLSSEPVWCTRGLLILGSLSFTYAYSSGCKRHARPWVPWGQASEVIAVDTARDVSRLVNKALVSSFRSQTRERRG